MSKQETGSGNYPESIHRRSRLEIYLEVLRIVKSGVKKPTRIMYAANTAWNPTQKILSSLVEHALIEMKINPKSRQSKKLYVITKKGINMLDYFDKANDIVPLEMFHAGDYTRTSLSS